MPHTPRKIGSRLSRHREPRQVRKRRRGRRALKGAWLITGLLLIACASPGPPQPADQGVAVVPPPGTILDAATGREIEFKDLIDRLAAARIVYVGEQHTNPAHHTIQLSIIQALSQRWKDMQVGMEMFAHTYQNRLDAWAAGRWDWPTFLEKVHWYANWKFDDALYRDILLFIQERRIKLAGLNIPFDLPPKIAIGGIESLLPRDRAMLPDRIDLTNTAHRAYVRSVYDMHAFPGHRDFENFYAAQCAWEDGMAHAIATRLDGSNMVVLAGNGHIVQKFGIPERAFARTGKPFITIYLAVEGQEVERGVADIIWFAEPGPGSEPQHS